MVRSSNRDYVSAQENSDEKSNKEKAIIKYGHISNWNTQYITTMSNLFKFKGSFNEPLYWDTKNVTDMSRMFTLATAFNQPIGDWDVSNVADMQGMFSNALTFNQPISNWDVSNGNDFGSMFSFETSFSQDIISSFNLGVCFQSLGRTIT